MMILSSALLMATPLGDVLAKAKGVNAAMVAEMRPEFAPNGLPIESGYIIGLPAGSDKDVQEAISALDKSLFYTQNGNERVFVDQTVDPCEIMYVLTVDGKTNIIFMQGSPDMVELMKAE